MASQFSAPIAPGASDELFGWLLDHKVHDENIQQYLLSHEITQQELAEISELDVSRLIRDIEQETMVNVQAITRHRLLKACRTLRGTHGI